MAEADNQKLRRLSAFLVGLVISAGFLVLVFTKIDLDEVITELRRIDLGVMSLTLISMGLGFVMMTLRSAVLLRPLHAYRPFRLLKSVLVGFAGNNVLPFRMGELLRVEYLARHGGLPHSSCLAVVAVERMIDLFCLVLLFFSLLPVALEQRPSTATLAATGATLTAAFVLLIAIARRRERFVRGCRRLTGWTGSRISGLVTSKADLFARGLASLGSPARIAAAAGFSGAFWLTSLTSVQLFLWAFGLDGLPWYSPVVVIVFVAFGTALPSTPAFIGTYHYFAMLALTLLGVDDARAGALAIVAHAVGIVPYTLVSIALLLGEFLRGELSGRPGGAS
jgi:uncharacterized protein (TIRG00374 family)